MMITIAQFSDRIGEYICQKAEMETEVKRVCYAVECFFVITISFSLISAIGWLFGVFFQTVIIQISALLYKNIIGGAHLSGFLRCNLFSAIILIGVTVFYHYSRLDLNWVIIIILLLLGILAVFRYAPKVIQVLPEQQIRLRKDIAIGLLILVSIINIVCMEFWARYILFGFLVSIFLITPAGTQLTEWIEKITKRKEVYN